MQQDRRRWLAPLLAALLLITGAVPARAVTAGGAHPAALLAHDRPAPDDAVRATVADPGDRGGVTERSSHATLPPTGTVAQPLAAGATAGPSAGATSPRPAAPNRPRAPPGSASPIPS